MNFYKLLYHSYKYDVTILKFCFHQIFIYIHQTGVYTYTQVRVYLIYIMR